MINTQTITSERCTCGHAAGVHGIKGDPGCTFCSCRRFERPVVQRPKVELTRFGAKALDFLSKDSRFKEVDKYGLSLILADGHGRVYPAGSTLVRRGAVTHDLHVVISGEVSLETANSEAEGRKPLVVGEGSLVGDLRAFSGDERSTTILALEDVEALEINTSKLKSVFEEYPDIFPVLAQVLGSYLAALGDTAELAEATTDIALNQYGSADAEAKRDGVDPNKLNDIRARLREMQEAEREEDRARRVAREAIANQTRREKR